jgi:catechol 2,3-dioxygenase-like lactoylglutathione lyase family enzyme
VADPAAATETPRLDRVVETALYVDDLPRAVAFYRDVLGLRPMSEGPRLSAVDAGQGTVLLLFLRGATRDGFEWPGGRIPPHDGSGPIHIAFGVSLDSIDAWDQRLEGLGIEIESRVTWQRGGRSLYFRDPDGHSLELVTPGTWENY